MVKKKMNFRKSSLQDELSLLYYLHLKVCLRFSCNPEEAKHNVNKGINFKHHFYSLISKVRCDVQNLTGSIHKHVLLYLSLTLKLQSRGLDKTFTRGLYSWYASVWPELCILAWRHKSRENGCLSDHFPGKNLIMSQSQISNTTHQWFFYRIVGCRKEEMFIYIQLIMHSLHNVIKDKGNQISISEENNFLKVIIKNKHQ